MQKWFNARSHYVSAPTNNIHGGYNQYGQPGGQPQLTNIADQHIVMNPENYNISLEEKMNVMLRVVGEMAEELMNMKNDQMNNKISPYQLQEIQENLNRVNMSTRDLVVEVGQTNPQLVGTLKTLLTLAQSDKLNELFKVMTILTEK